MEIYANFRQKANVNPIDVIEKLITQFVGGYGNWVEKRNNNHYIMEEISLGQHSSSEIVRQINDEELKYYNALKTVMNKLDREDKRNNL